MRWLDEDTVFLSCADEMSSGYVYHKAKDDAFSVSKPYQAKAPLFGGEPGLNPVRSLDMTHGIEGCGGPAPSSGNLRSARTKRKRSRVSADAQRAAREHEAQQRHLEVHERLLRAHKLYMASLNRQEIQENSSKGVAELISREGSMSTTVAAQGKLDLVALSHLKQAVRPKFTSADGLDCTDQCDLFDQLISNASDHDILADAAGHAVLLPPMSTFLIADIARLKPLLTGQRCQETCAWVIRCAAEP